MVIRPYQSDNSNKNKIKGLNLDDQETTKTRYEVGYKQQKKDFRGKNKLFYGRDVYMCLYLCGPVHPKLISLVFFERL